MSLRPRSRVLRRRPQRPRNRVRRLALGRIRVTSQAASGHELVLLFHDETFDMFAPPRGSGPNCKAVAVMDEAQLAAMRASEGVAVVAHEEIHWRPVYPGFYQPVHLLARIRAADVRQPARLCWGFRAALRDEDAREANASLPVHLLSRLPSFDESRLSRNRRGDLRRARRLVEFRRLTTPDLLLEQGHDVFTSTVARLRHRRWLAPDRYRERVRQRMASGSRLFVAGLVEGKLRGYLDCYAIAGVLHTDEIFIATDVLRTGIGTGLYFEALLAARDGGLHTVCNGLHRPEAPDLCRFKAGFGFQVVRLPARCEMPAPVRAYLKARRPATYYRLTGDESALAGRGLATSAVCDHATA